MHCTLHLFAHLADAVGQRAHTIECEEASSVRDILEKFIAQHPQAAPWRNRIAAAINDHYVPLDTCVNDGDTIALIPPVSGG